MTRAWRSLSPGSKQIVVTLSTLLVVGVCVWGTAIFAQTSAPPQRPPIPPLSVVVEELEFKSAIERSRTYLGFLEASRQSAVGFESFGLVAEVSVDEGDTIDKGGLIARLDTQLLDAEDEEAQAARDESRSRLTLAEETLTRVRGAIETGAVSALELDQAESELSAARASLARTEARLRSLDVRRQKASLIAPYDAVVSRRFVDEGKVVQGGESIVEILENSPLEARIAIGDFGGILPQSQTSTTLKINQKPVSAIVDRILPRRGLQDRSVEVIFSLQEDLGRPGDLVEWTHEFQEDLEGFWVPIDALTSGIRGLWRAYIAEPLEANKPQGTHRLSARDVEVLAIKGTKAFVRGSLTPEELLVVEGTHRLVPQQQVTLSQAQTAEKP